MDYLYIVSILGAVIVLMGLLIIFSGKWFMFGLKDFMAKQKYKSHHGYMFLVDKGGNLGIPKIIDLRKDKYSEKVDGLKDGATYPYSTDDLMKGTFLGRSYLIKAYDDAKTSIGFCYQESDINGNPLYNVLADGTRIKKITELKPSVTLSPGFFTALVGDHALTQALRELLQKNSVLLLVLLGIGVGIVAIGFVLYSMYSQSLPEILVAVNNLANMCTTTVVGG